MRKFLVAAAAMAMLTSGGAHAQNFTPQSKCAEVVKVFSAKDKSATSAAVQFMTDAVYEIDANLELAGKGSLTGVFDAETFTAISKSAVMACVDQPAAFAKVAAFAAYTSFRLAITKTSPG